MPCPRFPSRLLESRASHDALWLNQSTWRAFSVRSQPLLRLKLTRGEKVRRHNALNRLDQVIDPNDLSATLEAHRESNRKSLIQHVITKRQQDPEMLRPSFLANLPQHTESSDTVEPKDAQAVSDEALRPMRYTSISAEDTFPSGAHAKRTSGNSLDWENGHPMEETRRHLLRELERPFQGLSPTRSRLLYFESIRRLRRIIVVKQDNLRSRGPVKGIAHGILEYTGQYVPIKPSHFTTPMIEPWSRPSTPGQSTRQRLQAELESFGRWMEPFPGELSAREKVYDIVKDIVLRHTPRLATEKFGSLTTGLIMPGSDVDIRLFPEHLESGTESMHDGPQINKRDITTLCRALKNHPGFSLVVSHQGKYPLIGATHVPSGLAIQLVVSNKTSPSGEKVQQYLAEWPTLKPLYMLIKTILEMRGLSDVWLGGLGSYSIFMMVVASLKHNNTPSDNITVQLLNFLNFYGNLDTYRKCISVEPPQMFPKRSKETTKEREAAKNNEILLAQYRIGYPLFYQCYMLCLQDPADPYNDLGKKSFAIKDVQVTMKHLHDGLQARLAGQGRDLPMEPLIRKLVGRCDQLYDRRRAALELFGDGYLEPDGVESKDR